RRPRPLATPSSMRWPCACATCPSHASASSPPWVEGWPVQLILLSGGAAEGLVRELRHELKVCTGCGIAGTFGAVGAMREKLLAGAPADVALLTSPWSARRTRSGPLPWGPAVDSGLVHRGLAVRAGDPTPPVADARALCAALLAADATPSPDPKLATAGIHFAKVLAGL